MENEGGEELGQKEGGRVKRKKKCSRYYLIWEIAVEKRILGELREKRNEN
jgi:hypothetical protein